MMNVLITGANGFLGRAIYAELSVHNKVQTISRSSLDIQTNLSDEIPIFSCRYDLVVHCAGKAHKVPNTQEEMQAFFDVNVNGTLNLLTGLEAISPLPDSFVLISTVAVYGLEIGVNIKESAPLSAQDPYGQSKIEAEKLVAAWCYKNNVICTILRLPLLAGLNPPGNLGAMITAIKKGYYFNIDGGRAKKSILLTTDIAKIIPVVARIGGVYNLTDGHHPTFDELSSIISKQLGKSKPINLPLWLGKIMAMIGDVFGLNAPINSNKLKKITSDLTFDDSEARRVFGWSPMPVLKGLEVK